MILLAGIAIFFFAGSTFAKDPDLFSYDKVVIDIEMAALNDVEEFVLSHPGTTLTTMRETGNPLASTVTDINSYNSLNLVADRAFGIGGFWWGCCLGPAGVLVVYLVAEDSGETRSSVIGCIVSGLLYGGGILIDDHYRWGLAPWHW